MLLFPDTEVEVDAEPHAERVEVGLAALDGRGAFPAEETDLERISLSRVAEQIPCRGGVALIRGVREVRGAHDLQVLIREDVQSRTNNIVGTAGSDERRAAGELDGEVLERSRDEQELGLDADRLAIGIDLVEEEL